MKDIKAKILLLDELAAKVVSLKKAGRKVVQSHGIFDLVHPGVIKHLSAAKRLGDALVVTVVKDKDVHRGPGRPIFEEKLRAESVAALAMVDYVAIVDEETPFECIRAVNPDIFAKGQAFKERDRLVDAKIFEEEREFYFGKAKIMETGGFSLSSTSIINNMLDHYSDETRAFLTKFGKRYKFERIKQGMDKLAKMKVLVIGDGIIDEYHYVHPMNKSAKAHLVVNKYIGHEVFAGGAFAIANHIASICKDVHLVSVLGAEDSKEDYIKGSIAPTVSTRFFDRSDGPTIVKKRYINQHLNQKLFEVNYINDAFIDAELEKRILSYIKKVVAGYDLVLVSDFGHGLVTEKLMRLVERYAKKLAINTQTNGANAGYNLITKYRKPHFVCLDEPEVRLAAQDKFSEVEGVARTIRKQIDAGCMFVTLGKRGSISIARKGTAVRTPVFSTKVVDTVGAGDAFFSYAAPCYASGMDPALVGFIGNAAGAISVQIMGNKRAVQRHEVLNLIFTLLK